MSLDISPELVKSATKVAQDGALATSEMVVLCDNYQCLCCPEWSVFIIICTSSPPGTRSVYEDVCVCARSNHPASCWVLSGFYG